MERLISAVMAVAISLASLTVATEAFGRGGSHGSRCVGVCYGVPSTVNGLPRDTYVHGYVKRDGTVVQPYTRSK